MTVHLAAKQPDLFGAECGLLVPDCLGGFVT
jgi:hypothetical protein